MLIAKHDLNGTIWFEECKLSNADRKRIENDLRMKQSAMFQDRPDLWRKPPRKPKRVSPDQMLMFANPSDIHLDFNKPVACSLAGRA